MFVQIFKIILDYTLKADAAGVKGIRLLTLKTNKQKAKLGLKNISVMKINQPPKKPL